jgi:hypothetical protein
MIISQADIQDALVKLERKRIVAADQATAEELGHDWRRIGCGKHDGKKQRR